MEKLRIIYITGIWDIPNGPLKIAENFTKELQKSYPEAVVEQERIFYHPWQKKKIHNYAQNILSNQDTPDPIILFGFSLGGVIAHGIADRFQKAEIKAIVTVSSPLLLSKLWGFEKKHHYPSLSIAGIFDFIVPCFLSWQKGIKYRLVLWEHVIAFSFFPTSITNTVKIMKKFTDQYLTKAGAIL